MFYAEARHIVGKAWEEALHTSNKSQADVRETYLNKPNVTFLFDRWLWRGWGFLGLINVLSSLTPQSYFMRIFFFLVSRWRGHRREKVERIISLGKNKSCRLHLKSWSTAFRSDHGRRGNGRGFVEAAEPHWTLSSSQDAVTVFTFFPFTLAAEDFSLLSSLT